MQTLLSTDTTSKLSGTSDRVIRVGITERHGMADEAAAFPPDGVQYEFLKAITTGPRFIRSPIKGFMRQYDDTDVDIVEAVLSPAITDRPWVYSLDCFQAAMAFSLSRCPLPKFVRRKFLERLFLRDNFKAMIFWSQAARKSLEDYGGVVNDAVLRKATVVYPAVRQVPNHLVATPDSGLRLLFSGDFFRKGGAHVVDAFEVLRKDFPEATLRLCCDERIDFNTPDTRLRSEYLAKIAKNKSITLGRVPRQKMLNEILPNTDIYLLPTYAEAFGFAIQEAMAYGIPVVATNTFATPEIIGKEDCGVLIDTSDINFSAICKGYVVQRIPTEIREQMLDLLVSALTRLAASPQLRASIGQAARARARTKFSFSQRTAEMNRVYLAAIS